MLWDINWCTKRMQLHFRQKITKLSANTSEKSIANLSILISAIGIMVYWTNNICAFLFFITMVLLAILRNRGLGKGLCLPKVEVTIIITLDLNNTPTLWSNSPGAAKILQLCRQSLCKMTFNLWTLNWYFSGTSFLEYQAGGGKGLVDLFNQLTLERCHSFWFYGSCHTVKQSRNFIENEIFNTWNHNT